MSNENNQPVAGELPPLPEPHLKRGEGLTPHYTKRQMREYGHLCRASQPVQQPAAVETIGKHTAFESAAKALHQDWTPEKVHHLINVVDAYVAANIAIVPAAGVQGDAELALVLEQNEVYRMQMAAICTAAIGYWDESMNIMPECDTVALRDVAKLYAKYAALVALGTPDSGRDAALMKFKAINPKTWQPDHFYLCADVDKLLAAHPAPSSDAALTTRSVAEINADIASGGGLGRMDRLLKERDRAIAAHPAPSSDAAMPKPERMPTYVTPQMWQYRVEDTLKKFPSMSHEEAQRNATLGELNDLRKALKESHECRRELNSRINTANALHRMVLRQHANDLAAAHPANGAQAGDAVVLEKAAQTCDQQADGTNGPYRSGCLACASAVRGLRDAAAKKGGA